MLAGSPKAVELPPLSGGDRPNEIPLIGRDDELAELTRAVACTPSVTIIEGEPGSGKTRLTQELGPCLYGRAQPQEHPFTLGPVIEALSRAEPPPRHRLSSVTSCLRPLLPELADHLPPGTQATVDRHAVMRGLRELLTALAPATIVLEDLQWADSETHAFVAHLSARVPDGIALVCTVDPNESPQGSPLHGVAARIPSQTELRQLTVSPLTKEQTAQLAQRVLGVEHLPEPIVERVFDETAGIPAVAVELLRTLDQNRFADGDQIGMHRELDRAPIAVRVCAQASAALRRLASPQARRLVEAVAVLGRATPETELALIADVPAEQLTDALTEAQAAGLLIEHRERRYAPRHGLQGRAIEGSLASARRRQLHAGAARLLQPPATSHVRLARHFEAAGERSGWLRHGEAAADEATTLEEHLRAYEFLRRAVLIDELAHAVRGRLAVKLAVHASASFANREAIETVTEVLSEPWLTPGARGELRLRLGLLLHEAGRSKDGYAEIEGSIAELQRRPALQARAMSMLAAPAFAQGRLEEQLHWLDRAAETAARSSDRAVKIAVAVDRAAIRLSVGLAEGWRDLTRIPTPGPDPEELRQAARGYANISDALVHLGHYELARRWIREGQALPGAIADSRGMLALPVSELQLDWLTGQWGGLEERLHNQAEASSSWPALQADTNVILALLRFAQGDFRTTAELLDRYVEEFPGEAQVQTWLIAARAQLEMADGEPGRALRQARQGLDFITNKGVWAWAGELVPVAVSALIGLGRRSEAGELTERFASELSGRDAPAAAAAQTLCTGLLAHSHGDLDAAAAAFAEAESAWRALPRPYAAAKALERRGHCELEQAGASRARPPLTDALRAFRTLGASWDAARVRRTLRAQGIEPPHRRGRRGYGDELSPREHEVARRAAAGATNREIALELFLSPKTVEHYLSAAMRKLGVSTRTELPELGGQDQK